MGRGGGSRRTNDGFLGMLGAWNSGLTNLGHSVGKMPDRIGDITERSVLILSIGAVVIAGGVTLIMVLKMT